MAVSLAKKIEDYVKIQLAGEPTGHDWYHVYRVRVLALKIQAEEGGDKELVELAALLHDLGDYKNYEFNEVKANLVLVGMMDVLEIERDMQEKVLKIVKESQYRGSETKKPSTIEGRIIQDADWLDHVGAIGIARTFATGGRIGRILHDPNRKPRPRLSSSDYLTKKTAGTSFNYFYEKVLKLPTMMNTKLGKTMAEERVVFVQQFLDRFNAEWDCKK